MKWITSSTEVEEVKLLSNKQNQLIFKHSTWCPISARAFEALKNVETELSTEMHVVAVDVIAQRALSQEIAHLFSVRHESPQCLLVKDGKAIENFSHFEINTESLLKLKRLV